MNKSSGKSEPGPWSPAGACKGPEELGGNPTGQSLGGFYHVSPSQQHPGEVGPGACGERREMCAAGPRPQSVGQSPDSESWAVGAVPSTQLPESERPQAWGGPCPLPTLSTRAHCSQPGPAGPLTSVLIWGDR